MSAIESFKNIASQDRFKGWEVVEGSMSKGPKIPFFGEPLNYKLRTPGHEKDGEEYTSILRHLGWVVVLGITTDGLIPTLVQWKPGVNQGSWELPPGGIGKTPADISNEDLLEKTKFHYQKETGYGGGAWTYLGFTLIETGKYRGADENEHGLKAHMYLAENLEKIQDARNPEHNEIMETLLVPKEELIEVLLSGWFNEVSARVAGWEAAYRVGLIRRN